jgi:transcriptional regulator with XRE-family HTH domain
MEFRERLRHARERRGWNQNELARYSGVAYAVIHRLEAGVRGGDTVSVGVVKRLARTLGVSVDYLIGMYEDDVPSPRKALVGA